MNRAQGGTRALPDGFLHLQNFTVTKASGMAGAVFAYLLDETQKSVVETILVERALAIEAAAGPEWTGAAVRDDKHGCYRFGKHFLKQHFQLAVHEATKLMSIPVMSLFKTKLIAEREGLKR